MIFGFSFQGFSFQVGQVSCQVSVPVVIVITENISPSRVTSNKSYNNKQKTINLTISLNMRRSVVLSPFLATIVYSGQVLASFDAARFVSHFVFAARSAAKAFQTTAACHTNVLHPLAVVLDLLCTATIRCSRQNGNRNRTFFQISIEPPKGLRSNLRLAYRSLPLRDSKFYSLEAPGVTSEATDRFHRLCYGLCFFHGVVLDRIQFGPIGWGEHDVYEFSLSDLAISLSQLRERLLKALGNGDDGLDAAMRAVHYLTAECNYGGRITDLHDRRLLRTLLDYFFSTDVAKRGNYPLSETGLYSVPIDLDVDKLQKIDGELPAVTHPEAMGLNDNADINKNCKQSEKLLKASAILWSNLSTLRYF
jgi:hypothetical protein